MLRTKSLVSTWSTRLLYFPSCYFCAGQVLIPKMVYSPQKLINAVAMGSIPSKPHQLLKYNPAAAMAIPKTIRTILSVLPTFFFIVFGF